MQGLNVIVTAGGMLIRAMITAPATKDAQRAVLAIPMIVVNTTLIFLRYSLVIKMIKSV